MNPDNSKNIFQARLGSSKLRLAGETAAALAAVAIAFKPYNSSYSDLLLEHAKQCAKHFYASSGYTDELLWDASRLFRANGEENYLKYVVDDAVYMGGSGLAVEEFSWNKKLTTFSVRIPGLSYLVGYGPKESIHVHHGGASIDPNQFYSELRPRV
ncbi:hypothetical protein DITRI_Ditri08aG0072400 [Diplodiscus trichospermus]